MIDEKEEELPKTGNAMIYYLMGLVRPFKHPSKQTLGLGTIWLSRPAPALASLAVSVRPVFTWVEKPANDKEANVR